MAGHESNATRNVPGAVKKWLTAGGWALVLCSGLFAAVGVGAAVADGLDATPIPPGVIDHDGFQNYDTSSYPLGPSWPRSSWPGQPSWPGISSHPCCSR